jgi:hypothetical protein
MILVLLLAGWASGSSGMSSAPSSAAVATPNAKQLAAFVTAFRQQYPSLATGQSDGDLADAAESTCQNVQDRMAAGRYSRA